MESSKTYYGGTFIEKEELKEQKSKCKMELEYYTIANCMVNEDRKIYGIEVIKKEYKEQGLRIEKALKQNVSDNLGEINEIVDTLKKHEVTPIGLEDVLEDILKQKIAE